MPSIGDKVIRVGPRGATGATGSSGTNMPEPGGTVNGRLNGGWNRCLPLSGGSGNQLSGGLRFTNQIASSATALDKHLSLGWGDGYGFCITGSTLNCKAYERHAFYCDYGYQGEIRYKAYWFSTDHWQLKFNESNGNLDYLAWNDGNLWSWWRDNGGRFITWTHAYMYASGAENVLQVNGGGSYYYNVGSNRFNFNWDGTVYGRVDNAVQFAFVNGCDEKLKQDIAPSTFDCLAAIRKLRVYQFRWKDYRDPRRPKPASDDAPTIPIGFVAQRLYEDFPEAVVRKQKLVDKGALAMWSGDVNTLLATLCGAIQQLDKQVREL